MILPEDDEETNFEFIEEDENEVPDDRATPLSSMSGMAAWIMGILLALFILYWAVRFAGAVFQYFGAG